MIELRWLDAPLFIQEGGLAKGITVGMPRQKILQFRAWETVIEPGVGGHSGYGEWQNVPTVKYEQLFQSAAPDKGEK